MESWARLDAHYRAIAARPIAALHDDDPERATAFAAEIPTEGGMLRLDYGRTAIDREGRALLLALAAEAGVMARAGAMFGGAPINTTEGRAVLHAALRAPADAAFAVDGADVMAEVAATRARVSAFAESVRRGEIAGPDGPFTDVVNIGIGGSDLGPALVVEALRTGGPGPRAHFLSNVDGAHAAAVMAACNPRRTLVVIASKTFTTVETMTNAATLRAWVERAGGVWGAQAAAVSSARERTAAWGIDAERVFGFADWVGGRFSLWGPIGLVAEIALGPEALAALRAGAAAMDAHFRTAPPEGNLPLLLGLVGLWHGQVCGHGSRAVIPYDQRLERLPLFLQQLEMESNGKRVDHAGQKLSRDSVPVVWGAPGTNAQHAFMQAIHQGSRVVPVEFLLAARGAEGLPPAHHRLLVANCLAQAEALMRGRSLREARALAGAAGLSGESAEVLARHRAFPGSRPSVLLSYPRLTPFVLGQILALYEHRVLVEGAVLGLNSFDQWGVELGKELATGLMPAIEQGHAPACPATAASLRALKAAGLD